MCTNACVCVLLGEYLSQFSACCSTSISIFNLSYQFECLARSSLTRRGSWACMVHSHDESNSDCVLWSSQKTAGLTSFFLFLQIIGVMGVVECVLLWIGVSVAENENISDPSATNYENDSKSFAIRWWFFPESAFQLLQQSRGWLKTRPAFHCCVLNGQHTHKEVWRVQNRDPGDLGWNPRLNLVQTTDPFEPHKSQFKSLPKSQNRVKHAKFSWCCLQNLSLCLVHLDARSDPRGKPLTRKIIPKVFSIVLARGAKREEHANRFFWCFWVPSTRCALDLLERGLEFSLLHCVYVASSCWLALQWSRCRSRCWRSPSTWPWGYTPPGRSSPSSPWPASTA